MYKKMVTENSKNAHCFHLEAFFPHSDKSEHQSTKKVVAEPLRAQSETLFGVVCVISQEKNPSKHQHFISF